MKENFDEEGPEDLSKNDAQQESGAKQRRRYERVESPLNPSDWAEIRSLIEERKLIRYLVVIDFLQAKSRGVTIREIEEMLKIKRPGTVFSLINRLFLEEGIPYRIYVVSATEKEKRYKLYRVASRA